MFFYKKMPKKLFTQQINNVKIFNKSINDKYNKTILVKADIEQYLLYEYYKPVITCDNILLNLQINKSHNLAKFMKADEFNIQYTNPYHKLDFEELLYQIPDDYYLFNNVYIDIMFDDFNKKKIILYLDRENV
jgi:hypothetical protein